MATKKAVETTYVCPQCGYETPLGRLRIRIARFLGSKGGRVGGPTKAREGAALRAAQARWKGHVPQSGYKKKTNALEHEC